jgi:hypothetical protein
MPQPTNNAPDAHDVYNMLCSIGEEFGCTVEFCVRYYADYIQIVARARKAANAPDGAVEVQALTKYRYGLRTERTQLEYTLAFDLWLQLDGGGATAAKRGPAYGWNGRVETPRRRKFK